jgi:uncharacterized repeat protein (TIGR03803 family)
MREWSAHACYTIRQLDGVARTKNPLLKHVETVRFDGWADRLYNGRVPIAGLIAFKGALYGTTPQGGGGCSASQGCGAVFKITTSGAEQVLYAFEGGTDGASPQAASYAYRGTLYGTTAGGGGYSCGYASSESCGTVFKYIAVKPRVGRDQMPVARRTAHGDGVRRHRR